MKRQLIFDISDNAYVIREGDKTLFEIDYESLRFDSLGFYNGIFSDGRSANIELVNSANIEKNKKAPYVFNCLNDIFDGIRKELGIEDEQFSTVIPIHKKTIKLYDMAVCAGVGDYLSDDDISGENIETEEINADYALKISGKSMEPTIEDGSTILVKKAETAENGQIVIVNIDGESMVKRYIEIEGHAFLKPDNADYETINIDENKHVQIQGIVIEKTNL